VKDNYETTQNAAAQQGRRTQFYLTECHFSSITITSTNKTHLLQLRPRKISESCIECAQLSPNKPPDEVSRHTSFSISELVNEMTTSSQFFFSIFLAIS
jgi:hypothetical protein